MGVPLIHSSVMKSYKIRILSPPFTSPDEVTWKHLLEHTSLAAGLYILSPARPTSHQYGMTTSIIPFLFGDIVVAGVKVTCRQLELSTLPRILFPVSSFILLTGNSAYFIVIPESETVLKPTTQILSVQLRMFMV